MKWLPNGMHCGNSINVGNLKWVRVSLDSSTAEFIMDGIKLTVDEINNIFWIWERLM